MRAATALALTLLAAPAVFSQAPAPRAEFEVASVKPSEPLTNGRVSVGVHIDGAMVRCTYLSLLNYLNMAYDVRITRSSGPTGWAANISTSTPSGPQGSTATRLFAA